ALSERRHGVDGAIGVFYKPEGLTEGEGEVEAILSLARHFGRVGAYGNLVYGQDPEGSERDGELRLAALYGVNERLYTGLDTRFRFDLGSDLGKRRAKLEADWDLVAGPTASYSLGPLAFIGQAGVSAVQLVSVRAGAVAMGGVGASF